MSAISNDNNYISKTLRDVFDGIPAYASYADEKEDNTIDILSCKDSPWQGATSFGTLGLSDHSIGKQIDGVPLGVELVAACYSEFDFFPKVLATSSFNIINSKYKCEPGTIYVDVIKMYIESPLKHVMFSTPFIWDKKLETLYLLPRKIVAWLLTIPISDEELEYSKVYGTEALEELFEKEEVDILNLLRKSVC